MVEGLVLAGNFGVCLVQFAYKFYGIADGERRVSSEEVADGKVVGCPNRFVARSFSPVVLSTGVVSVFLFAQRAWAALVNFASLILLA